jgi:hypothetical protein
VKNNLPTPSWEVEESECLRWTRAIQGATQATIFRKGMGKRGVRSASPDERDGVVG